MNCKKNSEWYLGLDIGTDSVGWAVTDLDYCIPKYKSNAMWGVMLFDAAQQSAERRSYRTARRRLERRKQRILLLQEMFSNSISEVDKNFYIRLKESALYSEDKSDNVTDCLFSDKNFSDKDYYKKYPTIHHLINELMYNDSKHDVRLVYLACAYLLAHRGHFLFDVDKKNLNAVTDFNLVYSEFISIFTSFGYDIPWECDTEEFEEILKTKLSKTAKSRRFIDLLWNGKKPKFANDEYNNYMASPELLISLLCGGKVELSKLFNNMSYSELENKSLCLSSSDFEDNLENDSSSLQESEIELLLKTKALYDWQLLSEMLNGEKYISVAKVKVYEQHKKDLDLLKHIIKKYAPDKYNEMFKIAKEKLCNYTSYSYNTTSVNDKLPDKFKKTTIDEFNKYVKSVIKDISVEAIDEKPFNDMCERLETSDFCPKQVNSNNRVIPYQLYWNELNIILENASKYLSFLNDKDMYGTVKDKILSIMEFRIPYYVGPLVNSTKSDNAWLQRKKEGKIYPWNFSDMVDKDACEEEFIRRMTCKCTYLAGKDVLPKYSLLYSKFTVLNEINNIKVNDVSISVGDKQRIYQELFMKYRKVTLNKIVTLLHIKKEDVSGIDISIKASLKSYHDFKDYLDRNVLTESDIECIIEHITYTEDKSRLKKWLESKFDNLKREDVSYIAKLKYNDFGRLSEDFLTTIVDMENGNEKNPNIISMMWETNNNLMQLLSDKYSYLEQVKEMNNLYYALNLKTLAEKMNDMYISNGVKRPIIRTLEITKELKSIMHSSPKKIFIEMARGSLTDEKGKRTKSRKEQINELFDKYPKEEVAKLRKQLESKSEGELRSNRLYLYFTQLGKCMYSGDDIDIDQLATKRYDIDHIFPQSKIKDDSISNTVLVRSELNAEKSDKYPISSEIRTKMYGFWGALYNKNLINEIKFKRLIRSKQFTDDELAIFINRQLVETRQSTKAVANLLNDLFPDTEIVYVKAGLASEFRHQYSLVKCREVNDLHHAKDAYLNIVMGNVYNVKFTKSPMNFIKNKEKYTLNMGSMLAHDVERNGVIAWKGNGESITQVKNIMSKNNIRYVRYSYKRKGGFFNQNPERAKESTSLFQLKKGLSVEKYGGYNNSTATCFLPVKYKTKKTRGIMIIPVDLVYYNKMLIDFSFAQNYIFNVVLGLINLKKDDALLSTDLVLNKRIIKLNTVIDIDGFRATIIQKSNKGKTLVISSANSLILDKCYYDYIKIISSYIEKSEKTTKFLIDVTHSSICKEKNNELFDVLQDKMTKRPFCVMLTKIADKIAKCKTAFEQLTLEDQCLVLLQIVNIFKTGRASTCDLSKIGESSKSCTLTLNSDLSKLKEYKSIMIIDESPTGLIEHKSENLLTL